MSIRRTLALHLLLAACLGGCGREGTFSIEMTWAEGPPSDAPYYVFLRIEERPTDPRSSENRILGTAGPAEWRPGGVELETEGIPNGSHRVAIVEVRRFREVDAPVVAFGLSDWFTVAPRQHVAVPILLHATPTPAILESEGVMIETPRGRGRVNRPEVHLIVAADARAVAARISPTPTFEPDRTLRLPLEEVASSAAPERFEAWRLAWDLEHGQPARCPEDGVCARDVFVRAVDAYGYESRTHAAAVVLDRRPPALRPETALVPHAAGPTTSVQLTLVATEELARAPVIRAPEAPALRFRRILPDDEAPSATFTYLSEPFGAARPPDGTYALLTTLEDLATNVTASVAVGALTLDVLEPLISGLVVEPDRAGPGTEVSIRFRLEEDPEGVQLRTTVAGLPVESCDEPRGPPPLEVECRYRVTGDEAPGEQRVLAVLVTAIDRALNRRVLEHPLTLDLSPPSLVDLVVAPASARDGTRALVRLLASEALGAEPRLTFSPFDPGFVPEAERRSSLERLWRLTVDASTPEGEFELVAVTLADQVGNAVVVTATVAPSLLPARLRVDRSPPRIGEVRVEPSSVPHAPGLVVAVTFTVEEAFPAGLPRVRLGPSLVLPCREVTRRGVVSELRCEHTVTGTEVPSGTAGVLPLVITALDEAGSEASETATIHFDFAPAALLAAELTPSPARLGDLVLLRLSATEPLAAPAQLAWSTGAPTFTFEAGASTGPEQVFSLVVGPGTPAGAHSLLGAALVDLAGNSGPATAAPGVLPAVLEIDPDPPRILNLVVEVPGQAVPSTPPRVRSGGQVRVRFTLQESDPAGSPTVTVAGRDVSSGCSAAGALPNRSWTCVFTAAPGDAAPDAETTVSIVVGARDRAGNTASAAASLVYDRRLPVISAPVVTPSPAGIGAAAVLRISASEPLASPPALTWTGPNPGFAYQPSLSSATEHVYHLAVSAALASRTYVLGAVALTDLAGNDGTGAAGLPFSWRVDTTPPELTLVSLTVSQAPAPTTPPRVPRIAGRQVVADVDLREELPAGPPVARIGAGANALSLGCATIAGAPAGSQRWRCTYTVTGSERADGEHLETLVITASDTAGNAAVPLTSSLVFDFRAPALAAITLTPSPAGLGTQAVLRISASEALSGPPALTWAAPDPGFTYSAAQSSPTEHVFVRAVSAALTSRTYTLNRVELTDLAGNAEPIQGRSGLPLAWQVDTVPPQVTLLSLTVSGAGAQLTPSRVPQIAGRVVTATVDVLEVNRAGPPVVRIGSGAAALALPCTAAPGGQGGAQRFTCVYTTTGTERTIGQEHVETLTVEQTDTAGNAAVPATASIVFDYRAPALASATITPAPAGLGATAVLRISASEPLASPPALTWTGPNPGFVHQGGLSTPTDHVFHLVIGPSLAARSYVLGRVDLVDLAGNPGQSASGGGLPLSWLVDNVPPALTLVAFSVSGASGATSPPRVPRIAGRVITADVDVLEANPAGAPIARIGSGAGALALGCQAIAGGAGGAQRWRCTYTTTGNERTSGGEHAEILTVEQRDTAGNSATPLTASIVFDYRDPAAGNVSVSPSPAGLGVTAVLRVSATEALSSPPVLNWTGPNPGFAHQPGASTATEHVFHLVIASSLTARTYVLSGVQLTDLAGNSGLTQNAAGLPLSWLVDNVAPAVGPITVTVPAAPVASTPRRARVGAQVQLAFQVTEANPQGPPRVRIGGIDISASCAGSGALPSRNFACNHTTTGSELPAGLSPRERTETITVEVEDVVGQRGAQTAQVVFDFEPPAVDPGSVSVVLTPGAGNPLAAVTEVTRGTGITLRLGFSEPLANNPTVEAVHAPSGTPAPGAATFGLAYHSRIGGIYRYDHTVPQAAAIPAGRYVLRTTARDEAGNQATSLTGAQVVVDFTAPAAPDVLTANRIVLTRAPWGSTDSGGTPFYRLVGQPGAVEGGATVIATVPVSGAAPGPEIGRVSAAASGGFDTILDMSDRPTVTLRAVDAAGNESPMRHVLDGRWIVTLAGRLPGTTFPNPHRLALSVQARGTLDQSPQGAGEYEPTAQELAGLVSAGDGQVLTVEAEPTWERATGSGVRPGQREGYAVAYDTRRGRLVLFGGQMGGQVRGDLWEWDGRVWTELTPSGRTPLGRRDAYMVYEAARERILLFGGRDGGVQRTDVWAWDGQEWFELTSSGVPPARIEAAVAYHPARGEVVMFGGVSGTTRRNDIWVWNGSAWGQRNPPTRPPPMNRAGFAHLSAGGRDGLLLFGGDQASGVPSGSTWLWNGAGFEQLQPSTAPEPRYGAGMAWDPVDGSTLLFGGRSAQAPHFFNDLWRFTGAQWVRLETFDSPHATNPVGRPTARAAHLVYESADDRFLVLDGEGATNSGPAMPSIGYQTEHWSWERTRWRRRGRLAPPTNAGAPAPRSGHTLVSTPEGVLMHGGRLSATVYADTWLWTGDAWVPGANNTGTNRPSARADHAMAAFWTGGDLVNDIPGQFQNVVLFGGTDNQTWRWTHPGSLGAWTQLSPTTSPAARTGHAMVTDTRPAFFGSPVQRILMFGGPDALLWQWNGNQWSTVATSGCGGPTPAPRRGHAIVKDTLRERLVVLGGETLLSPPLTEIWELDLASRCWSRSGALLPEPRQGMAFAFDSDRAQTLVFGGSNGVGSPVGTLLTWNGSTVATASLRSNWVRPEARSGARMALDAISGRMLLHGGTPHGDGWLLSSGREHQPAARFSVYWPGAAVATERLVRAEVWMSVGAGGGAWTQAIDGAQLEAWESGSGVWRQAAAHAAIPGAPTALSAAISRPLALRLPSEADGYIHFRVRPRGFEVGANRARVTLDAFRAELVYDLRE